MCLKRAEKKKLLRRHNKVAKLLRLFNHFLKKIQYPPPKEIYKKAVLKNFAIFTVRTGKHLCWSLFLIQNMAKFLRALILKNICERLLLKICS